MFAQLSRNPAQFATQLAADLVRRDQSAEDTDIDHLRGVLELAVSTATYATKAKSLLTRPLRQRKLPFSANDWHACALMLYGLWQRLRPEQVAQRMAELERRDAHLWRETFPDDNVIDEARLIALYQRGEPLQANSTHNFNDLSLALRFFVAEMLTVASRGRGCFDWGGSDGITCAFLSHHGAADVHLFELNASSRDFARWLNTQLGFTATTFHDFPPKSRQFGAGVCTEVLEHVVDPPGMMRQFYDLLLPGGVIFVTSSFGVPQQTHLLQNRRYAGRESEMMLEAGFDRWTPPVKVPVPMLPQWGFWQRPV